jgi:CDP-glycerol glycerophosphotransferase (TagB/SpsB family)
MAFIQQLAQKCLNRLLSSRCLIVPKFNQAVILSACEDSTIAVANGLLDYPVRRVYVISSQQSVGRHPDISDKIRFVKRYSLMAVWLLLSSRYIFFTHGLTSRPRPSSQTTVNLWHGVGFKTIGILHGGSPIPADWSVVTGDVYKDIHSRAFGVPIETVVDTGLPRNDRLFLYADQKESVLAKANVENKYDKVVFWLPTYRDTPDDPLCDDDGDTENMFCVPGFDVERFNSFLAERNTLCIAKQHPLATRARHKSLSNILFIDDRWLSQHQLSLYMLVATADCLISDVSSVMVDYCLLDRPILCMMTDIENYIKLRGVTLSPIRQWLPATIVERLDEFLPELDKILKGRDKSKEKRHQLTKKFFTTGADGATKRLLDVVFFEDKIKTTGS